MREDRLNPEDDRLTRPAEISLGTGRRHSADPPGGFFARISSWPRYHLLSSRRCAPHAGVCTRVCVYTRLAATPRLTFARRSSLLRRNVTGICVFISKRYNAARSRRCVRIRVASDSYGEGHGSPARRRERTPLNLHGTHPRRGPFLSRCRLNEPCYRARSRRLSRRAWARASMEASFSPGSRRCFVSTR